MVMAKCLLSFSLFPCEFCNFFFLSLLSVVFVAHRQTTSLCALTPFHLLVAFPSQSPETQPFTHRPNYPSCGVYKTHPTPPSFSPSTESQYSLAPLPTPVSIPEWGRRLSLQGARLLAPSVLKMGPSGRQPPRLLVAKWEHQVPIIHLDRRVTFSAAPAAESRWPLGALNQVPRLILPSDPQI
jgi:hypothetical protein